MKLILLALLEILYKAGWKTPTVTKAEGSDDFQ
jgi:hypothetical protein